MNSNVKLSARDLDCFDRCPRRFAFERDWLPLAISPLGLLYRAIEAALPEPDCEDVAKATALKLAGTMELQVTALEPYAVTQHVGSLAGIIAAYLRAKLGILMPAPDTTSPDGYDWHPGTFEDACGLRHRIVLVDHWDDDRLSAEAHSWATIGELAATGRPLTLHAIVIGAHRGGRRHSPWAKGFLHPANRELRFGRRKGGKRAGLSGEWQEVWREKYPQCSTQDWLRVMQEDGALAELVVTRSIKLDPADCRLAAARRELAELQSLMETVTPAAPMRRSSCDATGRGPCPFQPVCYSPVATEPSQLPTLYRKRSS